MGKEENEITRKIELALAGIAKLGRVQCGKWQTKRGYWMEGAPAGTSDLCGWRKVIVTPDMVGKPVAIFTAIEVKTKTGVERKKQGFFRRAVLRDGGIAGVARTTADAIALLEK